MTLKRTFQLVSLCLILASCSDNSTSSENAMFSSLSTINNKLASTSALLDSATTTSSSITPMAPSISAVWDTDPGVIPLSNTGTSSLKKWLSDQFNDQFTNSNGARTTFTGRIASSFNILCFLSQAGLPIDSTTSLPTVGSHTFRLTKAMGVTCNDTVSDDMLTADITLNVAATTDTSLYDSKLSFLLPGSSGCPFIFYARVSDTFINIAEAEDETCDGRNKESRTIFTHDVANKTTRFFYISQAYGAVSSPTGFEMYRGYLNENTDEAYILGFNGGDDDGDSTFESGISFVVVGKPEGGTRTAISAKVINQTISDATYNACVNPVDMTIDGADQDTLICDLTGTSAHGNHTTVIQGSYDANGTQNDIYDVGETTTVGFTDETDIFTL